MVASPLWHIYFEYVANDWGEDGNDGHPAVVNAAVGEEAKGIKTQQGAIGESSYVEQSIDERLVVERPEGNDDQ